MFCRAINELREIIIVSSGCYLDETVPPFIPPCMAHIPTELRFIYVDRKTKMYMNSLELLPIYVCVLCFNARSTVVLPMRFIFSNESS